ncbi:hypothetical protein A4G30_09870 [Mycobacterium kansasii]|uniref:Uncharacterized protein n=2 Tax=Mycobacterium kansasii TaxID=1768 RepID=A0A653EE62_MYCKA|nr:hypothetical protein [Mycobacterium kansasii]AGZ54151.1 hypothetical protein MKAN_10530 [Mycobacterium kansasii ATCC 12478]KZS75279.1 hypothetical protein A4G30_09870 [Mycobacterium kansasii]VAZ69134.1 hypothetical protein LAUMK40_05290 [Mycobacterium kansasii]VAZ80102.1 hypothetical protein LAUMK7_05165 [Mycobacterium kansasii]VTO95768.1 hypothetical protein BIN_B_00064 [Mycobacterium kansasii]
MTTGAAGTAGTATAAWDTTVMTGAAGPAVATQSTFTSRSVKYRSAVAARASFPAGLSFRGAVQAGAPVESGAVERIGGAVWGFRWRVTRRVDPGGSGTSNAAGPASPAVAEQPSVTANSAGPAGEGANATCPAGTA